ncbi:type IV pilus modification PilV family protein [Planococcus versutus]|uniref:Prepilin-type N-terminal cleavage/methylation domain-containing protein n=1 Tax=Planococcus versutus TaxID=1302659 RepID=A0A1B1RXI2_9BACL|nr:type II secretion system protein [Planococcus versutus]ANU25651.1 hypothetical protein I858_000980 [Planococcus versutus]
MKNDRGFTLVEVLASLVILSIVLMSFTAVFANTNRLAVSNSEKLVVINLADAYLERVKVQPGEFIIYKEVKQPCTSPQKDWQEKDSFIYEMNGKSYQIKISPTQNATECNLSLLNVVVQVTAVNSKLSSAVEGYVADE